MALKKVKTALISVHHKDGLAPIVHRLNGLGITIYSTGGTEAFIKSEGIAVTPVAAITDYPSIFSGRVKTLHPKIFGGILHRRDIEADQKELTTHEIPSIDLVVVDLYPFEATVADGGNEREIIEKIDIGGISLIRAAAKNFKDVVCIASRDQYNHLEKILDEGGKTDLQTRKTLAMESFSISSHYDTQICHYFAGDDHTKFRASFYRTKPLRYGENPHQKGYFHGDLDKIFEQLHGKELSFNNLLDIDAAVKLMNEFEGEAPTFAILKHNNACGLAQDRSHQIAFEKALEGDPVSAFGGIVISNGHIDLEVAAQIHALFFEVVIAKDFSKEAYELLSQKKNIRILKLTDNLQLPPHNYRTILNGVLSQEADLKTDQLSDLKQVTELKLNDDEISDLLFASKICKHIKSNTIVLAKNKQLCAAGTGQTSRVDALKQAIEKALHFEFDLNGAVMASDAFFPFPDCVEIAHKVGIESIIQPGGAIKDQLSIDYCNAHKMKMAFTGTRHFKH